MNANTYTSEGGRAKLHRTSRTGGGFINFFSSLRILIGLVYVGRI